MGKFRAERLQRAEEGNSEGRFHTEALRRGEERGGHGRDPATK